MKSLLSSCLAATLLLAAVPATAHVVWGPDFQKPAEAMLKNTTGQGLVSPITGDIPQSKDPMLTIWGHADAQNFAGKSVNDAVVYIKSWKAKNKSLTTVEFLTTDQRAATSDPVKAIAMAVAQDKALKGVAVKSLALGAQAQTAVGVLLVDGQSGFCQVTATDTGMLGQVTSKINGMAGEGNNRDVLTACSKISAQRSTSAANKNKKPEQIVQNSNDLGLDPTKYTLTYGQTGNLRNVLNTIR